MAQARRNVEFEARDPDPHATLRAALAALDATLGIAIEVVTRRHLLVWRDVRVHLCGPEGIRRRLTLADLLPHSSTLEDL